MMAAASATAVRTLIVEDDPDACEAMSRALEAEGFHTDCAMSVGQALVKLETAPMPGAAIIDMRLPDASGGILLWRIRRSKRDVPIAVVTGIPDPLSHPELVREPPDRLFTKPLDLRALVSWLKSVT
jgi:two-component system, OmpR family, response regulator